MFDTFFFTHSLLSDMRFYRVNVDIAISAQVAIKKPQDKMA